MKYSFLIPYYHRPQQFKRTLQSFVDWYSERRDFELIIIEDGKQTEEQSLELEEILYQYKSHLSFVWINSKERNVFNPATAYNEGACIAEGDFFILTSPECVHTKDILSGLDEEFKKNEKGYVVCACLALRPGGSPKRWYQHTEHRNAQYHFCSALSRESYSKVGGFDERYTSGYGYDDNSFLLRIQNSGIPILNRDDLLVYHLWHDKFRPPNYKGLLERNRLLFEQDVAQGVINA